MNDIQDLKNKVGEILKQEISDYLPIIDEESSYQEASVLERPSSFAPNVNDIRIYNTYSSTESRKVQDLESEYNDYNDSLYPNELSSSKSFDSSGSRNSSKCYRTAMILSHQETVQFFKNNQQNNNRLWEAIERNDTKGIKKLLDQSQPMHLIPQVNAAGLNSWTALHMAAARGFLEICEIILSVGEPTVLNLRTSMNRTPLHLATIHNHLKIVTLLVNKGAKIDLIDNDYNTCLHYASNQGYDNIVEFLLKKNSNINIRNNLGRTPLDIALNFETFSVFIDYCKKVGVEISSKEYSRTVFYTTLRHNSREDHINKILLKSSMAPSLRDLQTFHDRPKIEEEKFKKKKGIKETITPTCKVGPQDFRGLAQLGKGSFGEVYLVEKIDTGTLYALKVLAKEKIFSNNLIKYAYAERNILQNITHPFIVKLNYAFQTTNKLAMVMDYCPHGDLGSHIYKEKHFTEEKAKFYAIEVLLALEELHQNNVIFRDLKPDNVVLDQEGHARLTDFGLSKEGLSQGEFSKSFCGSIAYLAPEMLKRSGHSRSVDWYLFGVLIYEMLVGSPPYYSSVSEQLFNNTRAGKLKIPKTMSENAKDIIRQLMNRDPSKRLGSSPRDSEEVKAHPFFAGTDWKKYYKKLVPPPEFQKNSIQHKAISMEYIFETNTDIEIRPKIDNWSVLKR